MAAGKCTASAGFVLHVDPHGFGQGLRAHSRRQSLVKSIKIIGCQSPVQKPGEHCAAEAKGKLYYLTDVCLVLVPFLAVCFFVLVFAKLLHFLYFSLFLFS